jgi:hypothetical protein
MKSLSILPLALLVPASASRSQQVPGEIRRSPVRSPSPGHARSLSSRISRAADGAPARALGRRRP